MTPECAQRIEVTESVYERYHPAEKRLAEKEMERSDRCTVFMLPKDGIDRRGEIQND